MAFSSNLLLLCGEQLVQDLYRMTLRLQKSVVPADRQQARWIVIPEGRTL